MADCSDSASEDEIAVASEGRTTGSFCCVPECHSEYGKDKAISFHDFPTEKVRRSAWLHAIHRDVGKQFVIKPKVTKVCGALFKESDYVQVSARALKRREKEGKGGTPRRRLGPDAVPSIFSFARTSATPLRKSPAKRAFHDLSHYLQ
eukprot:scpid99671/ scgid13521/ 